MTDSQTIHALAAEMQPKMSATRRYLHQHPEISFEEEQTAAYIHERLTELGVEHQCEVGGVHGIVGRIKGSQPGPTIAFRADFDALPIEELNDVPYRSQNCGAMHACGHDSHTSILLGMAEVLSKHPELVRGQVVFLFQPAEETPPGGAEPMVKAGCLDGVDRIYGLHVAEDLPVGTVGVHKGTLYAASDSFHVVISGKGGHGSQPQQTTDTLTVACAAIMAINTIISRKIPAAEKAVISVCNIHSESNAYNVLPSTVTFVGTVRTFSRELADTIKGLLDQVIKGVCQAYGAQYKMDFSYGYPVVLNTDSCIDTVAAAVERSGRYTVRQMPSKMGGEDFAYYTQKIPGCIYQLGVGVPGQEAPYPLHHARFDMDEEGMTVGLETMLNVYVLETQQ